MPEFQGHYPSRILRNRLPALPSCLFYHRVENAGSGIEDFLVHLAIRRNRFRQRDRDDLVPAQSRHLSEFAAMDHINSAQSIARSQHAIESARRTSTLDVSQNHGPRFEASALSDLARQLQPDTAQSCVTKLVYFRIV